VAGRGICRPASGRSSRPVTGDRQILYFPNESWCYDSGSADRAPAWPRHDRRPAAAAVLSVRS